MQSKGISPIGALAAGVGTAGRFWIDTSLLDRTRLNRFILISILIHLVVFIIQGVLPMKRLLAKPPPIHVKFIEPQKAKSKLNPGTIIDAPKPKKIEKPSSAELLASYNSRAHSNLKKSRDKVYRRHKTVVPKASGVSPDSKRSRTPPQKKFSKTVKQRTAEKERAPLPLSDRGTFKPQARGAQKAEAPASLSTGTRGSLSLLDGFDPDKYASLDTGPDSLEESDDEEAISLDTMETKYASYFARIKHQIERVWTYPVEAAQRGISGELTLRFRISKDGNLLGVRLVDRSGHDILDFAAVKAVKEAAPFYPFPLHIRKEKLSILATFIYSPTYGQLRR
ncbi:MAG: TonB family protein [Nitrospinaceae bacterium]